MAQPENLNLWDRLFNRYRKEIIKEGSEQWFSYPSHVTWVTEEMKIKYLRQFVKYRIIDRVTGSETIKKEYLN